VKSRYDDIRLVWCEICWAVQVEQPAVLDFAPPICKTCKKKIDGAENDRTDG
jgi:hypothetical protein